MDLCYNILECQGSYSACSRFFGLFDLLLVGCIWSQNDIQRVMPAGSAYYNEIPIYPGSMSLFAAALRIDNKITEDLQD